MAKTALITGASGGIGYELAKIFASKKCNLVLIARSGDKLVNIKNELEKQYSVKVLAIQKDLTDDGAAEYIHSKLTELKIRIDYLVNNAGFGDNHAFLDSPIEVHEKMIKLNILALVQMTYLFGEDMKKCGKGKILNVSSVAAFTSGPYMSIYYASKAFVLSFSEAVNSELKPFGVTVTTLCPGPTETGFEASADLEKARMFKVLKPTSAHKVAKDGFSAMMKGKTSVISGNFVKPATFLSKLTPRSVNTSFAKFVNSPYKRTEH